MKHKMHSSRWRDGSALLTVLMVVFALSSFVAVMVLASSQRLMMAKGLNDRINAKVLAEAGAADAYHTLSTNFDARDSDDAFPATSYGGGEYDAWVLAIGSDSAVITCTGTYESARETVVLDVERVREGTPASGGGVYDYAVVAGDEVVWTGCGVFTTGGLIHANGSFKQAGSGELNCDIESSADITMKGNSGFVDGDADAPSIDDKHDKIWGDKTEHAVETVEIPSLDLTSYYNHALSHGQVFNGNIGLSGSYTVPGGIMWVNGNLTLSGSGTHTGCFIATGNIKASGGSSQVKVASYPGLVSRDGDIKITGGGDYEGLVYARIGDIEFAGGGSLAGSIVCGGNFKKSGSSTVFNYVDSTPVGPEEGSEDGRLAVTAWQR